MKTTAKHMLEASRAKRIRELDAQNRKLLDLVRRLVEEIDDGLREKSSTILEAERLLAEIGEGA